MWFICKKQKKVHYSAEDTVGLFLEEKKYEGYVRATGLILAMVKPLV